MKRANDVRLRGENIKVTMLQEMSAYYIKTFCLGVMKLTL